MEENPPRNTLNISRKYTLLCMYNNYDILFCSWEYLEYSRKQLYVTIFKEIYNNRKKLTE
jgi:hypothetical protein